MVYENMKKYTNFDEMFNDDNIISPEEREKINFEVTLIEKMIETKEATVPLRKNPM